MSGITATAKLNGHELKDIPVLNPGGWFGKTWLIEVGGSYSSYYFVVEADHLWGAIEELADSERYGHHIVVADEHLGDYPEEDRHYGASGQVIDLDHLMIHGREGAKSPFLCRYFGDGLPAGGIDPVELEEWVCD